MMTGLFFLPRVKRCLYYVNNLALPLRLRRTTVTDSIPKSVESVCNPIHGAEEPNPLTECLPFSHKLNNQTYSLINKIFTLHKKEVTVNRLVALSLVAVIHQNNVARLDKTNRDQVIIFNSENCTRYLAEFVYCLLFDLDLPYI